jgi:hypothetical protein
MKIFFIMVYIILIFVIGPRINKENTGLPKAFYRISGIAAIVCCIIAFTMIADLALPKQIIEVTVEKEEATKNIIFGDYNEKMRASTYNKVVNGEKVQIHVSRIYDEIKRITKIEDNKETILFPTVDSYVFIFVMIIYITLVLLFLMRVIKKKLSQNLDFFIGMSTVFMGVLGIFLSGKLLLVHVFHAIPMM